MADMTDTLFIVLAAGEGTRMRSATPKVLHPLAGRPMLACVLAACREAADADIAVVVGPDGDNVAECARKTAPGAQVFVQGERLGTAHAVLAARGAVRAEHKRVLVLFGDTPLITAATLAPLADAVTDGTAVAVLGFQAADPSGYGRLLTDGGELVAIREEKDATEAERAVTFCNSGVMGFAGASVLSLLETIGNDNAKGEYYLTDAVEIARERGLRTVALEGDETEVGGINDRVQLAAAERVCQQRLRHAAMAAGATLIDPETVHLSHDTQLGRDVVVEPNVVFAPGVTVEEGARIRAFSHLETAHVGAGAVIGPYARLRPGADIAEDVRIGNFVEIKNAEIGEGAKVNHLAYVGDAGVAAGANVGAGTITCNYDGERKHRTEIGANAFIGSNTALVAPVRIGAGAYVGSGSVITKDVPDGALAIARGRQTEVPGWVAKRGAGKDKGK